MCFSLFLFDMTWPSTVVSGSPESMESMVHTNSMKSFWAVLKNGIYGTFHWFSVQHFQLYLDEFSFRLNEENYKIDTVDGTEALIQEEGVAGGITT